MRVVNCKGFALLHETSASASGSHIINFGPAAGSESNEENIMTVIFFRNDDWNNNYCYNERVI